MITLQQFREQKPQYADMDAMELTARIYKANPSLESSDVSFEEFADIFGVKDDIAATRNGFMDTINAIGAGIKTLPGQLKASAASAFQGGDVPAQDTSGVDNAINENEVALQGYLKEHGKNTGDSFIGITPADVAGAMSSLGFSGVSAATGLAAGATAALTVPVPGAGYAAGMGATGKTAYNMARNQITRTFRDSVNEERVLKGKQPMNDEEWAKVKSAFDEKAHEYGLWEAIPEAVGSAVGFKILTAPLKSLVGEKLTGNILGKLATGAGRLAAGTAEELTTETITQEGQGKIEYDVGLRDKQPTTRQAFNEVYGQTVALAGIMGVGAKGAHKAYTTVVDKFKPTDLLNPETEQQPYTGFKSQPRRDHLALGGYTTPEGPPPVGPGPTPQQVQNQAIINEQMPEDKRQIYPGQQENTIIGYKDDDETSRSIANKLTSLASNINDDNGGDGSPPSGSGDPDVSQNAEQSLFPTQSQEEQAAMEADIIGQRDAAHQQAMQKKHPHLAQKNATDFDNKVNSVAAALRAYLGDKAPQTIGQAKTPYSKMVNASLKRKKSLNPEVSQPPVRSVQPDMGDFKPVSQYRGEEKDKKLKVVPSQLPDRSVKPDMSFASPRTETDIKAHEAATSPENDRPEPTEGQIDAGNYKKGHVEIDGMKISIENPLGSKRKGKDKDGKEWSTDMQHHYGYVRGTVGKDKDHLDTFVKPGTETSPKVFVIDQVDPKTGDFDEHKVMIGFNNKLEAGAAYKANYEKGWKGGSGITEMSMDDFKKWAFDGKRKTKPLSKKEPKFVEEYKQAAEKGVEKIRIGTKQPGKTLEVPEKIEEIEDKTGDKKLTKKEKALEDYRKFLAGLSEDEVLKVGDLIEDEPKSPAGQILKMKKVLAAKTATNVPEVPREIPEKNSEPEQPVKKIKTYIGKNHKGAEIYEDGNGNRFHSEGDMLVGSPVGIKPGKGLDIKSPERLYADGAKDFLTVDEVKKFDDDKVKSVLDNSEIAQRGREQEAAAQEKAEKKAPSKKVVLDESGFTKRINRVGAATAPDGTDYSIQKDDAGYYIRTTKDGNRVEGQERFEGFPQASGEAVSRAFGKKQVTKAKKPEPKAPSTEGMSPELAYTTEYRHYVKTGKKGEPPRVPHHLTPDILSHMQKRIEKEVEGEQTDKETPFGTLDEAKKFLIDLKNQEKDQGRVVDARLLTKIGQVEKAIAEAEKTEGPKPEYGNKNKIFTKDAADKARELLKKKLSGTQLNTGLDPEILQAGIQLAGYHIEAGARSFAEYSKAMIADIGEAIKPYLRSFYEGVRYYPGFDAKGMDSAENIDKGKDADPSVTPHVKLASWVSDQLTKKQSISSKELFEQADSAYGGTQGGNAYTVKDAYDAMELGINKFIESKGYSPNVDVEKAITNVNSLNSYTKLLATQTKRTKEQNEFQQFSTPPAFAYIANWIADINKNDTVLEPSAGIGGLAVFAKNAGANVYVNEFSERRAEFLNEMGFNRVFTEDAAQLNNILPADVKPTVVIMNPPFSSTAGRTKKNSTMNGAKHIEQALERLQDNGRLVAIVGQGMSMDASMFKNWWDGIKEKYNVRANIGVSGKEYAKYGTTFDNQLIVIDKTGKTGNTLTGKVDSFSDLIPVLEDLKKEGRYAATETSTSNESNKSGQPDVEKSPDVNKGTGGKPQALRPSTDGMGDKNERGTDKRDAEYSNVDTGKNEPEESNVSVEPEKFTGTPVRAGSEPDTGTRSLDTGRSAGLPSRDKTPPKSNVKEISDSVYDSYIPNVKLSGSKKHITPLVESAAMADTKPPKTDYTPNIPNESIKSGNLTDAQLEAIIFAGTAHSKFLGDGSRKGFFIGDGTGVGKGREIAGIIWDNWRNGNKKAIWLSEKASLLNDAKRDLNGIGFSQGADSVFSINSTKLGESIKQKEGILFTQYATLRGRFNDIRLDKEKTLEDLNIRLNQIVKWAGKDFDGVIAFDEAHNMGNVIPIKGKRGTKKPANQALAGVLLQKMLPKAKVVYASATGATEVSNLAYATRLGLWGEGTPFKNTLDFVTKIAGSGISAMELVARDMKSLGLYIARSLSYADVKYDRLEHELSPEQTKIYDTLAKGWQKVLENIHAAIEETEGGNSARSAALSQFWGAHQRFFNQIITAMQMPTALKQMEKDIDAGHSVVVQLVSTNAEQTERKLAELDEDMEIEDLDMTPRESLMQFLERSFPTQQYEEYEDENGDIRTRPVFDSAGNPVQNQKAVELKQRLLQEMGSMSVPETALDMILQKFGNDTVAEVTGRKRRIIIGEDGKKAIENWSDAKAQKDIRDYMDDKKRILIFSEKGGTGSSYHAALDAKNQRLRRHYLIQPGWRADKAVQGLGRSHRSFQKQAPEFVLVTTNLPGQKRFLSSIARRLDQLGALTKGQRQTGGQGIFAAKDNLESTHAKDALKNFFDNLTRNRYDDLDVSDFERQTGLSLFDSKGNLKDYPEMSQFLNRILSMTQDMQNKVFDKFSDELDRVVQIHSDLGTLDVGLETITAQAIRKTKEEVAYKDEKENIEAKYVQFELDYPAVKVNFDQASSFSKSPKFYVNKKSGKIRVAGDELERTDPDTGAIKKYHYLRNPKNNFAKVDIEDIAEKWEKVSKEKAQTIWNEEYSNLPDIATEKMHLLTGTLLPLWDRLKGRLSVARLQTDDGERYLGRKVDSESINDVLSNLGMGREKIEMDGGKIADNVLAGGSVKLSNETQFKKSRVAGEDRIEYITTEEWGTLDANQMEGYGLFSEIIQWKTRWFVPSGDNAGKVIDKILKGKDIVSAQTAVRKQNVSKEPLYSTDDLPGQGVNMADIQKQFKGQSVFLGPDGTISVKFKNGSGVNIQSVKRISDQDYEFALRTGRIGKDGIILGKYQDQTITLSKDYSSVFTLRHETVHLLEDLGIINKAETISLTGHAKRLKKQGKLKFKWSDNMAENRANVLAQVLGEREAYRDHWLDKIIQRVVDFFDGLMHIGLASVRKLAREIESGKVFERETGNNNSEAKPQFQTTSENFEKWFAGSKVINESGDPLIVYRGEHGNTNNISSVEKEKYGDFFQTRLGSLSFGSLEAANTYAQYPNNKNDSAESPRVIPAYLSIKKPFINEKEDPFVDFSYIADKLGKNVALKFAKKHSEYIENTDNWYEKFADEFSNVDDLLKTSPENVTDLYIDGYPLFDDVEFVDILKKNGYDGAIIGGNGETAMEAEYRVFSKDQVRSLYGNAQFQTTDDLDYTGNPDFDTNVKTWKGILPGIKNVFIKRKDKGKNYKPDLNFVETTFGLLSHNADKIEGLKRFFNELIRRPEYKHRKSEELSKIGKMSLVGVLEDLQKHNKDSYNQLREYLLDRDVNQIGTLVKETETGWGVQSEKKNGKRTVLNDGIEFPSKEEAREWAIDYEVENYRDPEGRESLRAFRNLTAKLHDYYAGTWQEVIREYEKRGLSLPQVVQKTSTGENRIDLKVALAKMGERSSYYFPRQRSNGEWKVIGKKADGTTYIDYRDNRLTANMLAGRLQDQGYQVEPIEKVGKLSEDIFQSIESVLAMQATVNQALAETKLEEKLRGLEDFGLKAYWEGDTLIIQNGDAYRWSADVLNQLGGEAYSHLGPTGSSYNPNFRFKNASEDMAEIVTNALLHAKGVDQDISFTLAKAMAEQLADILRSRGSQARMIARMDAVGKEVPVGFETDPLKAIAQAVNSAAGGYAKRELALKATKAITGRLQNWEEFQESHQDYDLLNQLEQEREGLSANTESEKARIRKLKDQLKKLQQERVGTTTETEKGKRTRLLNISNIHDELNRIRVWTDPSKAANLQKKITRIRSNMHKDYQTSINDNRIDPKRQKNAYNDAVSALKNVLRNEEASDRVIKTVRGLTSLWFLGGRVSSAIVNLTSMGTSVPASMNAYGEIDFKKIPALIGKASKAYASFVMGKGHVSAEDRAILEEIDSRGWVAAQLNMEVVNAIKSGSAQKYSRFTELMMTPFKITEEFNRAVTILAAYNGIRVNNPEMSVEDALQKAKTVSDRAHGIYGEENTPALLRKGEGLHAVSSMYIFQTYLHNYYNTMAQMIGKRQAKAFIYMGLSGAVFGGISSAPIIAAAMMLLKALDVDEPEEEIYAMAEEIFGESGSDVARFGLPGLAGISLKGSLAPNLPDFEEPIDILGPIGGMMRNWWDGAVNITKGDYLKGAEKLLPLAAGNVVKGYRETTQGVTTRAGDPVFFGKEQIKGDVGTGVTRALGFNPTKIAKPREIQWSETTLSNKYAEDKREIYSQIVRYFGQEPEDRDPDDWKDIVLEARKFNAKVKSHSIERLVPLISSKSIKDRLKRSSRPTKRERLRGEEQESNTMVDLPEDSETMVHNVWFSETYGELNKLAKNIRNYQQSGDLKKAAKLARENVDKIKLRKLFKEVDKDVRKINKAIKLVNLSKLDQETKKKRIDVLTKLKNDKVRKVYRLVHDKMKSTVRG